MDQAGREMCRHRSRVKRFTTKDRLRNRSALEAHTHVKGLERYLASIEESVWSLCIERVVYSAVHALLYSPDSDERGTAKLNSIT